MNLVLAQPPWMGFEAAIKSATSTASVRTTNHQTNTTHYKKLHFGTFVNPQQQCGYSGLLCVRIYYCYTGGSRNGLKGVDYAVLKDAHQGTTHRERTLSLRERHVFDVEEYVRDIKQSKNTQTLLESIIRVRDPVQE